MQHIEIRITGHLDDDWAAWLEGVAITHLEGGETLLVGTIADQAALYGLIGKLRDLGAGLISVQVRELAPFETPSFYQDGSAHGD